MRTQYRTARQKNLVSRGDRPPRRGNGESTGPDKRHLAVFVPEIKDTKGQMIAGIERGHTVWQVLLAHMAVFATAVGII